MVRHIDKIYVRKMGKWCCLHRGIDNTGTLVDLRVGITRDMERTKAIVQLL